MAATEAISSVLLFFLFFVIIMTYFIPSSYLTGVAAAKLQRHLLMMKAMQ